MLHLWWARRPLAACRAVIFTSLVDDPGDPELTEGAAPPPPAYIEACKRLPLGKNAAERDTPRQRLFDFIECLVLWESTNDEQVLNTARAKNTSVDTLARTGVLSSRAGKVQLLKWDELDEGFDPDSATTVWEATHRLIRALNTDGEMGVAALLAALPAETAAEARQLAYRLYSICERKGWSEPARDYNGLVVSWGAGQEQACELREKLQQGMLPGMA